MHGLFCAGLLLVLSLGATNVSAREVGPMVDLCAAMNSLSPGEELALRPGKYRGPCAVRKGGTYEQPIVIRSSDSQRPAVIAYTGETANVIDVRADHVVLRALSFESTHPNADAIRIYARNNITVEDCVFSRLGGAAVVANHYSARGIVVRRNVIRDSRATAIYFGCHDGKHCTISDLLIEQNYIHGVDAPDPEIGYGIQVKLNSSAIIRDNVIADTKGPGIMTYGSDDPSTISRIERNFVSGSRKSSGIVIGGGPSIVRNNISVGNAEAGIGLENYGQRGLLRGIVLAHNTVVDNGKGGITAPAASALEMTLINNAAVARAGTHALPPARGEIREAGNLDCTNSLCFTDIEARDFSPGAGSPLRDAARLWEGNGRTNDDFFGHLRSHPAAIGAIERPSGPIPLGIKPMPPHE